MSEPKHLVVTQDPDFPHAAIIICTCGCGEELKLNVHWTDYNRWKGGELVQTVFPLLNADYREMLITGTCVDCWERIFSAKEI